MSAVRPWMPTPIIATLAFSPGLSWRVPSLQLSALPARAAAAAVPNMKFLRLMSIILFFLFG